MSINPTPTGAQLGTVITDARVRRFIYAAFVVVLVVAGAITVGFATSGELPAWVTTMNSVLGFLGVPVGGLAVANTKPATPPAPTLPEASPSE